MNEWLVEWVSKWMNEQQNKPGSAKVERTHKEILFARKEKQRSLPMAIHFMIVSYVSGTKIETISGSPYPQGV